MARSVERSSQPGLDDAGIDAVVLEHMCHKLHDTHSVEHRRTTWAIAQFQAPAFGPQIFVIGKPDVARRIVSAIADQKGERLICVVAGMRQPYRALEKRFPVLVWFLKLERFFGDLYA